MGVFRQLGDPVCPDCLCQHHGAAYAEIFGSEYTHNPATRYDDVPGGATIIQQTIVITERCCVTVNTALITNIGMDPAGIEIERPLGTLHTTQEDEVTTFNLVLHHHAAWEVLDPGTYTYFLVNRLGYVVQMHAAWIKIIASDCEA